MDYIYCWYHHMIPEQEKKEISETIRNKNYEKFLYLYQQYAISSIFGGRDNYLELRKSNLPTLAALAVLTSSLQFFWNRLTFPIAS